MIEQIRIIVLHAYPYRKGVIVGQFYLDLATSAVTIPSKRLNE